MKSRQRRYVVTQWLPPRVVRRRSIQGGDDATPSYRVRPLVRQRLDLTASSPETQRVAEDCLRIRPAIRTIASERRASALIPRESLRGDEEQGHGGTWTCRVMAVE